MDRNNCRLLYTDDTDLENSVGDYKNESCE